MPTLSYLDYNATAPLRPAVLARMVEVLQLGGNASSVHGAGRRARRIVEEARAALAHALGCAADGVVFTGSGSEANNLAIAGCGRRRVVISAVEHDSVRQAADGAATVPVDGNGIIDLGALDRLLAAGTEPALVSVMLANNETGALQPVAEASAIARRHGALVHCDAVQALGKVEVGLDALGVDYLSVSAHKIGGPQGVGALAVRPGTPLRALIRGGGQERGRRAGTENVAAIAGFGVAVREATSHMNEWKAVRVLRDAAESRLKALAPEAAIMSAGAERLPNTLCIALPGVEAQTQLMALDLAGIAVSAGSACSSGKVHASHVLEAMGVTPALARSAIRVSLGWQSTMQDVDRLVAAWGALRARAGRQSAAEVAA